MHQNDKEHKTRTEPRSVRERSKLFDFLRCYVQLKESVTFSKTHALDSIKNFTTHLKKEKETTTSSDSQTHIDATNNMSDNENELNNEVINNEDNDDIINEEIDDAGESEDIIDNQRNDQHDDFHHL